MINQRTKEKQKPCNEGQGFGFWDGRTITTVEQFEEELKSMKDEEFLNHVNADKNDFSSWIRGSIGLNSIADLIQNINSKQDMILAIDKYFAGN